MMLSRLSSNLPIRPTIIKTTRSSSFSTATIPSWATLDPSSLGTATTPHAVSNLVSGQWNATTQKQLIIPNPLNRDGPAVCILPDTTVEELDPFIESLKRVSKSGVHNPLKNVERYLMFGEISRKVRSYTCLCLFFFCVYWILLFCYFRNVMFVVL